MHICRVAKNPHNHNDLRLKTCSKVIASQMKIKFKLGTMEISPSITRCASQNTSCVECMCLMTLIQEHVSAKHSMMDAVYFELSEWQQSGYKQTIKWTLECDRCDYKSTSKALMFEHIANHQLLEDTVHRLGQSAPGMSPHAPSATHLTSHNSLPTSLHSTPPPTSTKTSSSSTSKPRKKNVPFKADIFHKKYLQPPKLSHKLAPYLTSNKMEPVEITSPVSAVYSPETLSDHTQSLVDSSRESDGTATVEVTNKTAEEVVIKMDEEDIADGLGNQTDMLADNSFQFNNGFHPIGEFSLNKHHRRKPHSTNRNEPSSTMTPPIGSRTFDNSSTTMVTSNSQQSQQHICELCTFTDTSPDSLTYHYRLEHKVYNCDRCDYRGDDSADLENHAINVHKSVCCIFCGKETGSVTALRRHHSLDHGTTVKKCSRCSFTTMNKSELTHHFNVQHLDRKPQKCSLCEHISYSNQHMQQHIRAVHEKSRPFSCLFCDHRFGRKYLVQSHMRRKHRDKVWETKVDPHHNVDDTQSVQTTPISQHVMDIEADDVDTKPPCLLGKTTTSD